MTILYNGIHRDIYIGTYDCFGMAMGVGSFFGLHRPIEIYTSIYTRRDVLGYHKDDIDQIIFLYISSVNTCTFDRWG